MNGVEKCFAFQAGREVRIIVKPEEIKDEDMVLLARELAKKIENELKLSRPGKGACGPRNTRHRVCQITNNDLKALPFGRAFFLLSTT